jgi:hypothetical protein
MRRLALTFATVLCCLALPPAAFAQSSKSAAATPAKKDAAATTTTTTPVSPELMKARMKPPVKGTAAIEFIAGPVKIVNGEVMSVIKVKNVENGPIVGLKIDEYFYAGQKEISACTARVRNPIAAGEIIDVPISCPNPKEKATGSNLMFTHSGGSGKVQPKPVKKFADSSTDVKSAPTKKK